MKKLLTLVSFIALSLVQTDAFSQGTNCATADPFCTGTTYTFPNNTGVADMGTYQCLTTTPNPAWYYLQIANSGNIDIHITQTNSSGSGIDVDFIMWGPFTSVSNACATITPSTSAVDCSYSTAATEDANIPSAVTGQFYMLLLTNFSNQPGTISFSQTGGTGSTDCSIVCGPPNATTGAPQTLTCSTTSVSLSASSTTAGVTYSWTGPGIVSGGTTATPVVNAAGTYTVTVTDPANAGCPATATQVVNLNNTPPNIVAGGPQTITCVVTSVSLNANSSTPGATYSWAGAGIVSGGTTATPTVNAAGTYTVTVTDPANGCTATATQVVNGSTTVPTVTTGATQTINCTTTSTTLNATSSGVSYSWTGPGIVSGGTTATPTVNAAGTYTVIVTDNSSSCTDTATQDVINTAVLPNASAGSAQTLTCSTTSVSLSGSSTTTGVTYSWSGPGVVSGGTTATPTVNAAGTYTVTVTDPATGCTNTATQTVNTNTTAPNVVTGLAQTITCADTTATLTANSSTTGATYSWAGPGVVSGGTTTSPTVDAGGTYTVTVTDPSNGCSATATQLVNTNTTPPTAQAGSNTVFPCNLTTMNLSGTGSSSGAGFSYNWTTSNGGISSGSNTLTPSITQPGTYYITVTNSANGCVSTDSVVVTPDVLANASFTATPTSGTPPLSVTFTNNSTGAVGYVWNLGDGTTSTLPDPANIYNNTGSYVVTLYASNANGCVDSVQMTIDVHGNSVLVVPNVFTPNGDGSNDIFQPVLAEWLKSFNAEVYDRWGLKMYDWSNENAGWNGQSKNGSPAPDGAYYYIISAQGDDGKDYKFTGYVQLIRQK